MSVDVDTRARQLAGAFTRREFDAIHGMLAPELQAILTAGELADGWNAMISEFGAVRSVGPPSVTEAGPGTRVAVVRIDCATAGFDVRAVVDPSGAVGGLRLVAALQAADPPPWTAPDYVDENAFTDSEIVIGHPPLQTRGSISVPTGAGPFPGVVLLSGSGPMDRDSSLGPNKPMKDLAWGLATRGVAVLRFDKATYSHPETFGRKFTVADEYLVDASAAANVLRSHPRVDPQRTFVAGHSLGGTVAPRVAALDPMLAGLIVLAGAAQPLHHAIVRQMRYLISLRPGAIPDADPAVREMAAIAALVDGPSFDSDTPASDLPLSLPASYLIDLLDHDPVRIAAGLAVPMLILQGGRDYQVTVDDDLSRWRAALTGRADVTITVYPGLDHQFVTGSGRSGPADYLRVGHVDATLVADIAKWILDTDPHH